MNTKNEDNAMDEKIVAIKADFQAINEALEKLGATVQVTPVMMMDVSAFESEPGSVTLAPREWFQPYAWWGKGDDASEVIRMFFFFEPHERANSAFVEACKRASAAIGGRQLTPAEVVSMVREELEKRHPIARA